VAVTDPVLVLELELLGLDELELLEDKLLDDELEELLKLDIDAAELTAGGGVVPPPPPPPPPHAVRNAMRGILRS